MLRQNYSREINVEPKLITVNPTDEKFMANVLKVVEENIDNTNFSVVVFAKECNMSRNTLLLKIKAITGENVNDFISSIRMKKAAQLLETDLDIAEIGYKVGFTDPTYFTKCFRKYFAKTPSQYRK